MARRRKKKTDMAGPITAGLLVLIVATVAYPWVIFSLIISIGLLYLLVLGIIRLIPILKLQFEQEKHFKRVSYVRSAPQFAFMSPEDFEFYVGKIYKELGYKVEVTKQTGDSGIDIILTSRGTTTAVQVKRYLAGNVGRPDVQRLVGASLNKFDKMIFVTTSSYSPEAVEYAASHGVELVDGKSVAEMSEKVFGKNYNEKALAFSLLERKQ